MRSWRLSFSDPISAAKSDRPVRREKNSCSRASVAASARQLARHQKKVASGHGCDGPDLALEPPTAGRCSAAVRGRSTGTRRSPRRSKRRARPANASQEEGQHHRHGDGGTMVAMMSTRILKYAALAEMGHRQGARHDDERAAQVDQLGEDQPGASLPGAICRRRQRAG